MFEKGKKRADYKLVGAQLPPQFHNYLTLYSLAKNISKISIIKQILEGWMTIKPNPLKYEEESILIKAIEERLRLQWKIEKSNNPELTFDSFLLLAEKWLKKKDINDNHIRIIISHTTEK